MKTKSEIKEGDEYPVWWYTGKREGSWNMAIVLEVKPYTGLYKHIYSKVLRLSAPNTKRGWLEMSVR